MSRRNTLVVTILPASPQHVDEIARLAGIVWRRHYPGIISSEQIEYMLARMYDLDVLRREIGEGITYARLLADDELAGFAAYGPAGTEMKLHKLYIHPQRQRCGFGTALLGYVEKASSARGFRSLMLTVNKRNQRAIAAYRKAGFAIRESAVFDIGGGFVMDDYVMAKPLTLTAVSE